MRPRRGGPAPCTVGLAEGDRRPRRPADGAAVVGADQVPARHGHLVRSRSRVHAHRVGPDEGLLGPPAHERQLERGAEQRVAEGLDGRQLHHLGGAARQRLAEALGAGGVRGPVLPALGPRGVAGAVVGVDDLEGQEIAGREPGVAERVGRAGPHQDALGRPGGQAAGLLPPVVDRDLAQRGPRGQRGLEREGQRRPGGVGGDVVRRDGDVGGARREGHEHGRPGRRAIADGEVDQAGVALDRGPAAGRVEVSLGGDPVEAVVEEVPDVGEELDQGDGRVGDGEVRRGVLPHEVLDEGLPQRAPVARQVVVHRRGRRERRRRRGVEAGVEVRAFGTQPHRQPGAQRIEGHRGGRRDLEAVAAQVRRTGERQLDVRRRRRDRRGAGHRDRRAPRRRDERPEGGVDQLGGRVAPQPDVQRPRGARHARLGRAQPVDAGCGQQALGAPQRGARGLEADLSRHATPPRGRGPRRAAGGRSPRP